MTHENVLELRNAGFTVDDKNEPVTDNTPLATTVDAAVNTFINRNNIDAEDWGFYGVDQRRISGGGFCITPN